MKKKQKKDIIKQILSIFLGNIMSLFVAYLLYAKLIYLHQNMLSVVVLLFAFFHV